MTGLEAERSSFLAEGVRGVKTDETFGWVSWFSIGILIRWIAAVVYFYRQQRRSLVLTAVVVAVFFLVADLP